MYKWDSEILLTLSSDELIGTTRYPDTTRCAAPARSCRDDVSIAVCTHPPGTSAGDQKHIRDSRI